MSPPGGNRTGSAGQRLAAIRHRLADDRGYTLVELLMAASLMIVVLSASLLTFELFLTNQSAATSRFDAQDRARTALDRLARDLRNVTGANAAANEIDQAGAYDLVFWTTNPAGPPVGQNTTNIQRVRYCVDSTTNPASETLWYQVQTWTTAPTPPTNLPSSSCPDRNWSPTTPIDYADHITNQIGGQTRAVFSYTSSNGRINAVHTDLFVAGASTTTRATVGNATETRLSSGVFLRNQDVPPTAAFTATPGNKSITLDGSVSSSPQGSPLTYVWYDGQKKICANTIVCTYNVPIANTYTISLKVYDPAGVEGDAPAQAVTVS
jgi:type II secretory pathway component PulJ